ncbi:MAG: hypothetical protein SFU25_04525 [Candidatus Caenarcaniphilales bacterium]|nr:hypothetical protein [Candidatus Caenarcaniphilales bacterium]
MQKINKHKFFRSLQYIAICLLFSCNSLLVMAKVPSKEEVSISPLDAMIKDQKELIPSSVAPFDELSDSAVVLQGSATRVIDKEAKITISLMSLLSSEFSSEGDLVEAKILVKPNKNGNNPMEALRGSKLIGKVVEVKPSRKAGRAGYVRVQFDTLKIKSGKEFPVKAEMTTESFKGKEAGKLVVYDLKLMTLGALWGTYNSIKWSPLAAISTNGLSVAASAGVGVALGVIGSFRRKGETKSFFPGEKRHVEFQDPLSLSDDVLQEAALASKNIESELIGLKIQLLGSTLVPSEEYEKLLEVKVKVDNNTDSPIYPCDLLLIPQDGGDPVTPDLRTSGLNLLKSVSKGQSSTVNLIFPISSSYSPNDFSLALVDPLDKAHLSKVPLTQLSQISAQVAAKEEPKTIED